MGVASIFLQIRRRREIIAVFRDSAACTVEMARPLEELGLRDSPALRKLMRQQVVHREQQRYYLDDRGLIRRRMNNVKWGMIALFFILGLVILYLNRS
ncbi:MAG: hypothetical protein RB296_12795 [Acidobacteriota bacterium]|jgi:hypothetical protein|nr:hypothetical protein [Acidobacteriota bacterium]